MGVGVGEGESVGVGDGLGVGEFEGEGDAVDSSELNGKYCSFTAEFKPGTGAKYLPPIA